MTELALRAFLTLFVVVDPVGIAPVFLALAGDRSKAEQARIARRAVLVGGAVLFFFALGGPWLLGRLGISMDAFRIAGGILLFRIAVGMVLAAHERETREEEEEARSRADVSVFPLAIPLIAGPGAMASTMILVGQAGSDPRRLGAVSAMAVAVLLLTWLALRLASPLGRVLRRTGVNVVTRVLGVLLAALAVQYVADGVRGLLGARRERAAAQKRRSTNCMPCSLERSLQEGKVFADAPPGLPAIDARRSRRYGTAHPLPPPRGRQSGEVLYMGKLQGKAAIVTGATSGMGRATAILFAREGASVVASGQDPERGASLLEEIRRDGGRVEFVAGDVGRPETNERLVETCRRSFGGVDTAVCCAGMLGLGSATEVPLETWRQTLAVNLDAVFYLMRFALPEMRRRGGGSFVAVASIAAMKGFPNHAAYCASKGALVALVRQVAIDYGPDVRVNALCPGPVDTPLIWASAAAFPDPAKAVADVGKRTLLKRLGRPEDVARAALFLASSESDWVTGTSLTVDGGIMTGA